MTGRIFSGIQPTGALHLGNYLGAINNWVAMQETHESIFCIVDLHAVTVKYDPEELAEQTRLVTATYIASGIDPGKSIIFNQSQVSGHAELAWLLGCITPLGWLNRMTQFKEKAGKHREKASLGLYAYPVLMAADILLYRATHVPVGDDQKQHIELARDLAGTFNHTFQPDYFPLPEPQIFGTATRVMSLRDGQSKMSKSDPSEFSRIHLTDNADTIALKIRKARTDADPLPANKEGLEGRPEAANLIGIYAALLELSVQEVCEKFAGTNFSTFKNELADLLIAKIEPIRQQIEGLMQDRAYLDSLLSKGAQKADKIAQQTLNQVHEYMGLLRG